METLPPPNKNVVAFVDCLIIDYIREKRREHAREEGREEALNEKNRKAAINMIRKGYSDADICDVLEVTAEYVSRVRGDSCRMIFPESYVQP